MRRSHARTRTGARTWRRCGDDAARQGRARVLRSAACSGAHVCVRPPADMCAPRGLQARRRCLAPRRVLRVPRRCSAPGAALKGKLLRHPHYASSSRRVPGTRPRMHWRARPLAPGLAVHTGLCYAGRSVAHEPTANARAGALVVGVRRRRGHGRGRAAAPTPFAPPQHPGPTPRQQRGGPAPVRGRRTAAVRWTRGPQRVERGGLQHKRRRELCHRERR